MERLCQLEKIFSEVDWEHTSKPLNRKDLGYWLKSTDATIVGNIFDNPGLLGIKRTGE